MHIIREGEATLYCNGDELETLDRGDFFAEDSAIFDRTSDYTIVATSALEFCTIKASVLKDIPIVQWKLIESLERRRHLIG